MRMLLPILAMSLGLLGFLTVPARADSFSWLGLGDSDSWQDTNGNWNLTNPPYPGYISINDTVFFGVPGAQSFNTFIDASNLIISSITYGAPGYTLTFNESFVVTNGISASYANAPNFIVNGDLLLGGNAAVGNLTGSANIYSLSPGTPLTLTMLGTSGTFGGGILDYPYPGANIASVIVGDGTDTVSQTLTGSGLSTYTGTTTIMANATLINGAANSLSAYSAHIVNGTLSLSGGSSAIGSLSGSGIVNLGANTLTINNGGTTFSGSITGSGGAVTLSGTGTLNLTGTNTYTGITTISAGKLAVNGSIAGGVDVKSGGTLGGSGTIGGNVTLESGGTLSPGNSPGKETIMGSLTLNSGSLLEMEFNGTTSGLYDQLDVQGIFTTGGTLDLMIDSGYTPTAGDTFTIFDGSTPGYDAGSFTITTNLDSADTGLRWDTTDLASEGIVSIEAVPEPSTWALLGISLAIISLRAGQRKYTDILRKN